MHIYTIYCIEKRLFSLNYSGYESWTIFGRSPFDLSNINAKLQYIMSVSKKSAFLLTCRVWLVICHWAFVIWNWALVADCR